MFPDGFNRFASGALMGALSVLLVLVSDAYRGNELQETTISCIDRGIENEGDSEPNASALALPQPNTDFDLHCAVLGNACSVKGFPSRQVTCTASTPTCCCSYGGGSTSVKAVRNSSHCASRSTNEQVISRACWREESRSSWLTRPVISLVLIVALCAGALLCVAGHVRRQAQNSYASSLDQLSMFVLTFFAYFGGLLHYTIIIPEAYSFSTSLNRNAADSGSLIGSAFLFPALVMVATQPCHSSSLSFVRVLCAFNFGVRCLGALFFFIGANPATAQSFSLNARYHICLVGRILGGACQGFSPLFVCAAKQMTPLADQVRLGSMVKAAATLGLGLGPLTSNLVNYHMASSITPEERAANPFLALAALNICLVVVTLLIFPTRSDISENAQRAVVDDHGTGTTEALERGGEATPKAKQGDVLFHHATMWIAAMVLDCERSFTLASLEAGVAFILEYYVGWTTEAAGYACSIMCVFVVPFLFLQFSLRENAYRDMRTLQVCGFCAVALPLLLGFLRVSAHTMVTLFVCILMFLFACIAGGICNGYAYKVSARAGYFTVGNFLIASGCLNGASRYVAPPLSRWLLQDHGVSAYAAMLLISGAVGAIALLPFRSMTSSDFARSTC